MAPIKDEVNLTPEGFAPIRNGLREHIKRGKFNPTDLGVYAYLQLEANWGTGIYHGTAEGIAHGFSDRGLKPLIQKSLRRLRENGFINYRDGDGTRKGYDILIHKFRPRSGKLFGYELNAWSNRDKVVPEYVLVTEELLTGGGRAVEEPLRGNGRAAERPPIPKDQEEKQDQEESKLPELPSGSLASLDNFVETRETLDPQTHFQIAEDEPTPTPVKAAAQPPTRVVPPAPKVQIVKRDGGHRWFHAGDGGGLKCLACKGRYANYVRDRKSCPNEEDDLD